MSKKSHEIAPGITAAEYLQLNLNPTSPDSADWKKAVQILDARIRERFFTPVDELIALEKGKRRGKFGFAILAIDCLVIETLQGFREGIKNHDGQSKRLFTNFLVEWSLFVDCVPRGRKPAELAKAVYVDCRCALLHSGSTGENLTVGISGDAFAFASDGTVNINRTLLHQGLKQEFDTYLVQLLTPEARDLRKKFVAKLEAIAGRRQFDD